ncbi:MAG: HAD-IA family hydrolase [DPANN group archaeon]|nr:HAD-IA family hydrolase [DPANN group archaeon]
MTVALFDLDHTLAEFTQPNFFEDIIIEILRTSFSREIDVVTAHKIVKADTAYLDKEGIRSAFWLEFDKKSVEKRLPGLLNGSVRAMPGAHALLTELEAREYYLGVVTNTIAESAKITLDYLSLARYFSAVSANDGKLVKPNPEPALRILRPLKNIESILFFGDSGYDVGCGKRLRELDYAIKIIYLERNGGGNKHGADFCVASLKEGLNLLEKGLI